MYIPSNLSSILCLGHKYQSWQYLVILSFDFFIIQDSRLLIPSTQLLLGSLPLVLVRFWVMLPPPPSTVSIKKVLCSSNLDRRVVSARSLTSLGSVFVHYFAATMLLYLSVAFLMRSPATTSVHVYQSYLVLSMKRLKVEFCPENKALNMCLT